MDSNSTMEYPPGCLPISSKSSVRELISKLKMLDEALREIEPNDAGDDASMPPIDRFPNLLEHLTKPSFLNNPNKDVQLPLACCIANLFRICAPQSPIADTHLLKKVLMFLVRNLEGLSRPLTLQYNNYFYLLENLAATETLQLAIHLGDDAQPVLRELIKIGFGSVNENANNDVEVKGILLSICSKLIQSVDQVSNSVIDAILFFIAPPQKVNNKESFRMARDLIISNRDTIEPQIQFLLSHAVRYGELLDCDLINEKKIFNIIWEIHEFEPEIIYPIIPYLTKNLSVIATDVRRETTSLIGNLLSSHRSKLADEIPDLWKQFKSRFSDVDRDIRIICVKKADDLILFHPAYAGEVTELVMERCADVDWTVRLETIRMVVNLARRKFSAVSEKLLECVAERTLDRKVDVRHETVKMLSSLFRAIFLDERLAESERSSILVVFKAIIALYCQPLQRDRILIEKSFVQYLVPYKTAVQMRMRMLIETFLYMLPYRDIPMYTKAYGAILSRQSNIRRCCHLLVQLIKTKSDGNEAKIESVLHKLADFTAEPAKALRSFQLFAQYLSSDNRSMQLTNYMFGDSYTCEKVEGHLTELTSRMRDNDNMTKEDMDTIQNVLERGAPLQVDCEAIQQFLSKTYLMMQDAFLFRHKDTIHKTSRLNTLLKLMAENYPKCFVGTEMMIAMVRMFDFEDVPTVDNTLKVLRLVSPHLNDESDAEERRQHQRLLEICDGLARNGNPHTAKCAVRCIAAMLQETHAKDDYVDPIVEEAIERLKLDDGVACARAFRVLGSAVEAYPAHYKDRFESLIMEKVARIALSKDIDKDTQSLDGVDVNEDEDVEGKKALYDRKTDIQKMVGDKCLAKLMALKFMCTYLVAQSSHVDKNVELLTIKTLKLFSTIVKSAGNVFDPPVCEMERAQLRAMAGCCILKLAACREYTKLVTVDEFISLSSLVHDDVTFVRWRFVSRLMKHLEAFHLSVEYMGMLSLVALVADRKFKNKVKILLEKNIVSRRKFLSKAETQAFAPYHQPEYCLAYAIYILSKYPAFTSYSDEVTLSKLHECLWYLLQQFHSTENSEVSDFIHVMFQDIKNCRDATLPDNSAENEEQNKKIWALCDLGILLFFYRMRFPFGPISKKRPILSRRFFIHYPAMKNTETYLPQRLVDEVKGLKRNRTANTDATLGCTSRSDKTTNKGSLKGGNKKRGRAAQRSAETSDDETLTNDSEDHLIDMTHSGAYQFNSDIIGGVNNTKSVEQQQHTDNNIASSALADFAADTTHDHRGAASTSQKSLGGRSTNNRRANTVQIRQPPKRSNGSTSTVLDDECSGESVSKAASKEDSNVKKRLTSQQQMINDDNSKSRPQSRRNIWIVKAKNVDLRSATANISPILTQSKEKERPTKRQTKKTNTFVSSTPLVVEQKDRKRALSSRTTKMSALKETEETVAVKRQKTNAATDEDLNSTMILRQRRELTATRQFTPELPTPRKPTPRKSSSRTPKKSPMKNTPKKSPAKNIAVVSKQRPTEGTIDRWIVNTKAGTAGLKKVQRPSGSLSPEKKGSSNQSPTKSQSSNWSTDKGLLISTSNVSRGSVRKLFERRTRSNNRTDEEQMSDAKASVEEKKANLSNDMYGMEMESETELSDDNELKSPKMTRLNDSRLSVSSHKTTKTISSNTEKATPKKATLTTRSRKTTASPKKSKALAELEDMKETEGPADRGDSSQSTSTFKRAVSTRSRSSHKSSASTKKAASVSKKTSQKATNNETEKKSSEKQQPQSTIKARLRARN